MIFLNGMVFGTGAGLITIATAKFGDKIPNQSVYILVAIGALLVAVEIGRHFTLKPSHKVPRPLS